MGLGVLEEKRDSDSDSEVQEEDEENLDTDEEGNVFDKLLRRTRDPGRKALVERIDPERKGNVHSVDSSEATDSSDEPTDEDEQKGGNTGVTNADEVIKKRRAKDGRDNKIPDNE